MSQRSFLMGVEIVEDDVKLAVREGVNKAIHEAEELNAAAALGMRRDDPPGGDFKRCEQRRGAVPLVVVALAPRLAGGQVDIVLAQEAPDILNINVAQCLGQQRTRPAGITLRRRLIQKRQNALVRGLAVDRLLAPAWQALQPTKAMFGKAPPPVADNARLNAHFLGDRTGAATLGRQQHYSRPLHVALRRGRCPAARLKHLPYLRLEPNFSCFGNHPNLES